MISQPERWQRISRHTVGDTQYALFIDKLMDEQGWDKHFAEQAVGEYLRFAYLACISPTPVGPSRVIDAVWHLHLTFSRDYWQCFCPQALGRELHHEPSGNDDLPRMQQQYQATLALYEQEFGTPAPMTLWGGKQPAPAAIPAWPWLAALTALFGTSVAIAADDASSGSYNGLIALAALALLIVLIWRLLLAPKRIKRRKDDGGSGCSSCSSAASCGSSCGRGGD